MYLSVFGTHSAAEDKVDGGVYQHGSVKEVPEFAVVSVKERRIDR